VKTLKEALEDGDDNDDDADAMSIDLVTTAAEVPDEAAGAVDWKKTLGFYYRYKCPTMVYRGHLTEYICMLAGRIAESNIQCSGSINEDDGGMPMDLYVPSAGMRLTTPLDPSQLRTLIDGGYCEQAPVGRGAETVVDLDTRKCWRLILGKDVLIGNQRWNDMMTRTGFNVNSILHKIQENLMPHTFGVADVWAQPYSMLIYEVGDFFKVRN